MVEIVSVFFQSRALLFVIFFLNVFLDFLPCEALAREDLIPGSRYGSAQGEALGDAAEAFGHDPGTSLFYNPANIGRIRQFSFEPLNYSIYGNGSYVSNLNLQFYKILSLSSMSSTLQNSVGSRYGAGWSFFPNIGFPGFSFGILSQSEFAGRANADGSTTYQTVSQLIPTLGFGFRIFNGAMRFGYSLQLVNEAVGTVTASAGSTLSYTQGLSQGTALSHNFGWSLTLPMRYLPTLDVVVRNAGGANYHTWSLYSFTKSSSGVPATELMSYDSSLSCHVRLGQGVGSQWAVVYRDISDTAAVPTPMAHLSAGVEVSLKERFLVRAGFRGGYPSVGLALKKPGTELSMTYYTEEIGTSYLDQGDTRVLFQFKKTLF